MSETGEPNFFETHPKIRNVFLEYLRECQEDMGQEDIGGFIDEAGVFLKLLSKPEIDMQTIKKAMADASLCGLQRYCGGQLFTNAATAGKKSGWLSHSQFKNAERYAKELQQGNFNFIGDRSVLIGMLQKINQIKEVEDSSKAGRELVKAFAEFRNQIEASFREQITQEHIEVGKTIKMQRLWTRFLNAIIDLFTPKIDAKTFPNVRLESGETFGECAQHIKQGLPPLPPKFEHKLETQDTVAVAEDLTPPTPSQRPRYFWAIRTANVGSIFVQ
jgi:hypothetical protein